MVAEQHTEQHFKSNGAVRDIILGMSDGLTVPFALAAGLSGAVQNTAIIITAGLAEIAAGSISMGLGGYLAGRSDVEHYTSERRREEREVVEVPHIERQEVSDILQSYGLTPEESAPMVKALCRRPSTWVDFMMRFELGLDEPDPRRALFSALTIAGAYILGGFIPLAPYIITGTTRQGLLLSVIVTMAALAVFGYIKGRFTGMNPYRSALQTLIIGGVAAAAAYLIARAVGSAHL